MNVVQTDVPLKERFYIYRGVVLHQRINAAKDDQAYWDLKNTPVVTMALPMLISLPQTVFTTLGTWYDVLPPTTYPLPQRDQNTVLQISLGVHLLWTAISGSQALCDWSFDGGAHFDRTLHTVIDKTDDSSVNGTDVTSWIKVSGTNPQIRISARQYAGVLGMTVAGTQTTAWPALQSYAVISDQGPLPAP